MIKVLIVDDEKTICNALKFAFNDGVEYEAVAVDNILDLNAILISYRPDIILLDLNLGEVSGLDVIDSIKNKCKGANIIMMTAYGTIDTAIQAIKKGALDYVSKPLDLVSVKETIKNSMKFSNIQKRIIEVNKNIDLKNTSIVGDSEEVNKVFEIIEKISKKNVNVLIQGESGTGKELVARAIHNSSTRKFEPFIAINCGAIPENLIESELFGYEKGAFTGADTTKKGKFEMANGGTLFLDEVGELSLQNQVKLLRVLQEKIVQPLGNGKPIKIDIRLVAATNRKLKEEIKFGNFRSDLYFRLNVVPIFVPSLSERKSDIPLLVQHFINLANDKYNMNIKGITQNCLNILMNREYPGNIRELENIIYSTVLLSDGDYLTEENLILDEVDDALLGYDDKNAILAVEIGNKMADIEEKVIMATLKLVNGNKLRASKVLGISERSIHYKIKNYYDRCEIK